MIKKTAFCISIIIVFFYLLNSEILAVMYPAAQVDYDIFLKYYYAKDIFYEAIICALFLFGFVRMKGKQKAVFSVGLIISGCSIIDKALFGITTYIYTDLAIVALSIATGIIIWNRE